MPKKLNRFNESHGELTPGNGLMTGLIGFDLAILGFLGVMAFHFPECLATTPFRESWSG